MKLNLKDGNFSAKELMLDGYVLTSEDSLTVHVNGVRPCYKYENSVRTNVVDAYAYACIDPKTYHTFEIRFPRPHPDMPENAFEKETIFKVTLDTPLLSVRLSPLKYGQLKAIVTAPIEAAIATLLP